MLEHSDPAPSRRSFLAALSGAALVGLVSGCGLPLSPDTTRVPGDRGSSDGALTARPDVATVPALGPGTHALGVTDAADTLLHVPPGLPPQQPVPLVLTLHGAGSDAEAGLALLRSQADERGLLLLAPASRGSTWDAIQGGYGPDVRLIDEALHTIFQMFVVDPDRIAVAGFSDGASYALGLGLGNGELFTDVIAFSPGFVPGNGREGSPRVFVSHGTSDGVLPIDRTSRRIVPVLQDEGLDVTYREFAGPHVVPPEVAEEAADWLGWGDSRLSPPARS